MYQKSFTSTSWWNKPGLGVPTDPHSAEYIAAVKASEPNNYLSIGVGAWRFFWADSPHSGLLTTVTDSQGDNALIHAPANVDIMAGNDKAVGFRCFGCDAEVGLFEAVQVSPTKWTCTNFSLFHPSTDGIAGSEGNDGHRGVPPSARCITGQELRDGFIGHRMSAGVASPADTRRDGLPMPIWPMNGWEKGHGTAIPEGTTFLLRKTAFDRVNPQGVARVIATAARDYGFIVGDTGGHATVKTQLNDLHTANLADDQMAYQRQVGQALDAFTWDDYKVLTLGWDSINIPSGTPTKKKHS